ncbi:phosphotransferase enzyme family protein [Herpetosiphon sp. NSE202]|uniref:phosphotransferase enzyme family protein n=1 Tax=Herpetosiphon sp. NSE202 TaxID=3351349 RepID=UPI0036324C50
MLEKPQLSETALVQCINSTYGLKVRDLSFLPLGADAHTAVYRVVAADETPYFLKLRRMHFVPASVLIPTYLHDVGMRQVIPAIRTQTGSMWAQFELFTVVLYPYVAGLHSIDRPLSDEQWRTFGSTLKTLHTVQFPSTITADLPQEQFAPHWRERLAWFLAQAESLSTADSVAAELVALLKTKAAELHAIITRTAALAQHLQQQPPPFVLCHADCHGWNLLVVDGDRFFLVDWDTLLFAPKERDLMFIGAGLFGNAHSSAAEAALFYQGYGSAPVDQAALSYYRYERIIEDIAVYCAEILDSATGAADRRQALVYLQSNFLPGSTIALARQGDDQTLGMNTG